MEDVLKELIGKKIDFAVGTSGVVRGEVIKVDSGVVFLADDEKRTVYIAIDKITVVWEVNEIHSRPGFVL